MKSLAIRNLYPQVTTVGGEKYCWDSEGNKVEIDEVKVQKELEKLQAEYDAQEYARKRQAEYPPWNEQLDKIFHDGVAKWKSEMVQPVKDKYPKPE